MSEFIVHVVPAYSAWYFLPLLKMNKIITHKLINKYMTNKQKNPESRQLRSHSVEFNAVTVTAFINKQEG